MKVPRDRRGDMIRDSRDRETPERMREVQGEGRTFMLQVSVLPGFLVTTFSNAKIAQSTEQF